MLRNTKCIMVRVQGEARNLRYFQVDENINVEEANKLIQDKYHECRVFYSVNKSPPILRQLIKDIHEPYFVYLRKETDPPINY